MAGSLKTLNIYQNGSSIYEASTFTAYGIWTDGNKIYKTNNHTPQSGDTELVTLTTTISGLYHNADGEQVNVGLNTVLVITTLAATDIIVYCVNASNKTTLDLSTLSDIADGAHTVKVKAKADGYIDSEFSNEVSYTKTPESVTGTLKYAAMTSGDHRAKVYVGGVQQFTMNIGTSEQITIPYGKTIHIQLLGYGSSYNAQVRSNEKCDYSISGFDIYVRDCESGFSIEFGAKF